MKKAFKVLFFGLALFMMCGVANAQIKIAYVNTSDVLDAMPDKVVAEKELEKYYNELQNQLRAMYNEYQTKLEYYNANQHTMSSLMKQSKEKELVDLESSITAFQSEAESMFDTKRAELLKPLLEKIQNAINIVGEEKHCSLILDSATGVGVYYGTDIPDYTKNVKTKLGIK